MGFWSGFEGLTGHRPGAFKGFKLKDIIDKDMWERRERLNQGRRFEETGVPETTNWYRGRGRPEMMGPRVGAASPQVQLNAAEKRVSDLMRDQGMQTVQNMQPNAVVSRARPWPNLQAENLLTPSWAGSAAHTDRDVGMGANRFLQLGDPRNIRSGPDLPPASGFRSPAVGMLRREPVQRVVPPTPPGVTDEFKFGQWFPVNNQADEKTVIQNFADPLKPNKITTTFETKEQPQSQPTSIMNMFNVDAWRDLARRKWEERMRARRGY